MPKQPGFRGRTVRRRCISVPGVAVLAVVLTLGLPLWVPVALLFDLVRGKWRLPVTRLVAFALCWSWLEVWGVAVSFALWASGQVHNVSAHYRLQRMWAGGLMLALRVTVGVSVRVDNVEVLSPGPALVLSRHASLADSLVSAWAIGNVAGLQPRYVLKRELMAGPCLDIVGHRLPNYFLNRSSHDTAEELKGVAQLANDLGPQDVAVIFPEGTRVNDVKRGKILTSMSERNPARAARLAQLQRLLPPKPAGAIALMTAAPNVDVVIAGHTGFDGLDTFGGMLRRLECGSHQGRMWFRRVSRADIPDEKLAEWLDDAWLALDQEVNDEIAKTSQKVV